MPSQFSRARVVGLALLLALSLAPAAWAQNGGKKEDAKKRKPTPDGVPVLWTEPTDIASRDLFEGPGGASGRPDTSRVTFVRKEEGGFSKKFRVRDGAGRVWVAKVGKEAQSETAATRLVWAAGYPAEVTYLVPCVRIGGAPAPKGEEACAGGGYRNVRFEARAEGVERLDLWKWDDNPFRGTRELQGLKVMMALVENWDTKDDNNKVIYYPGAEGGRGELRYVVSDLGATFGAADGSSGPVSFFKKIRGSRNEPGDYARDEFVAGVEGDFVRLEFSGKNADMLKDIRVADAAWLGSWLSRLSDRQIADAFRAANYTDEEIRLLAGEVRERIEELVALGGAPPDQRPTERPAEQPAGQPAAP
ncbi:MAG TPA: hypothetical protein VEY09_14835 [Pyrinomonadaceae bacterium]|nr:hypothetical protein [Pyrinomonadaceae bacterium]